MKAKVLVATAIASTVLVGCGVSPVLKSVGINVPGQVTAEEREAKRYEALGVEEICDTCDITGGGAGNDLACEGAKFGLVALDTDELEGTDGKGHLQFQFEDLNTDINVGGKVDFIECLNIIPGENGKTEGTVRFGGTLMKTLGLDELASSFNTSCDEYNFVVTATDINEPNEATDDELRVQIFCGAVEIFDHTCFTEDGNLQIHPTRAAQL